MSQKKCLKGKHDGQKVLKASDVKNSLKWKSYYASISETLITPLSLKSLREEEDGEDLSASQLLNAIEAGVDSNYSATLASFAQSIRGSFTNLPLIIFNKKKIWECILEALSVLKEDDLKIIYGCAAAFLSDVGPKHFTPVFMQELETFYQHFKSALRIRTDPELTKIIFQALMHITTHIASSLEKKDLCLLVERSVFLLDSSGNVPDFVAEFGASALAPLIRKTKDKKHLIKYLFTFLDESTSKGIAQFLTRAVKNYQGTFYSKIRENWEMYLNLILELENDVGLLVSLYETTLNLRPSVSEFKDIVRISSDYLKKSAKMMKAVQILLKNYIYLDEQDIQEFLNQCVHYFPNLKGQFTPGTKSVKHIWDVKRNIYY